MVLSAEQAPTNGSKQLKRRPTAVVKRLTRDLDMKAGKGAPPRLRIDADNGHFGPVFGSLANNVSQASRTLADAYASAPRSGLSAPHMAPGLLERAYGPRASGR